MKRIACLIALTLAGAACAASTEDDTDSASEAALVTLTAAQCRTPTVSTRPLRDSSGAPVDGTARTSLSGCIVGSPGETGVSVVDRVEQRLGDTRSFANLRNESGGPVFTRFTPRPATGSLTASSGLVQDVDVALAMDHSPSARLRVVRRRQSDGTYAMEIRNVTAFTATLLVFPVTVIEPGKLTMRVTMRPESNGITVTGTAEVTLEVEQQRAESASTLVRDLFSWLRSELDASAPDPVVAAPDAGGEASIDAGEATAVDAGAD